MGGFVASYLVGLLSWHGILSRKEARRESGAVLAKQFAQELLVLPLPLPSSKRGRLDRFALRELVCKDGAGLRIPSPVVSLWEEEGDVVSTYKYP